MRFLTLMLFFTVATVLFAQNNESRISNSDIGDSEKIKLENKFKALSTFYIDNTGLVVYKNQDSASKNQKDQVAVETITETEPSFTNNVIIVSESDPDPYSLTKKDELPRSENKIPAKINDVKLPLKNYKEEVIETPKEEIVVIEKQPISAPKKKLEPIIIVEEDKGSDNQISIEQEGVGKPVRKNIESTKTVRPQGSIFDRKKSQYKNMEEAALAVESILSELKKEQSVLKGSGSMSTRLSRGVTKDLRKKDNTAATNSATPPDVRFMNGYTEQSVGETDFGVEPSYFINGVQVDKIEVNKLQKSDIINREIRTRNTVTNNPNGEVWYTVKVMPAM